MMIRRLLSIILIIAIISSMVIAGLAKAQVSQVDPDAPTLHIVFNPTGTHVDEKGHIKIRLDFYPTETNLSYASQRIYTVDETSAEYLAGYPGKLDKDGNPVDFNDLQDWVDSLPHTWVTNPCLCVFVQIDDTTTKAEVEQFIADTYSADITAAIDWAMAQSNSAHLISAYMKDKGTLSNKTVPDFTEQDKEYINSILGDISVSAGGNGDIENIAPQSIDVGPGATNRATQQPRGTFIDMENPANADGTIDTMEVYFADNGFDPSDFKMGVFFESVAAPDMEDRDYEDIGAVSRGSKQTFTPVDCDVETGDYVGCSYTTDGATTWPAIEKDSAGELGFWYIENVDKFGSGSNNYNVANNSAVSLYATGVEASSYIPRQSGTTIGPMMF